MSAANGGTWLIIWGKDRETCSCLGSFPISTIGVLMFQAKLGGRGFCGTTCLLRTLKQEVTFKMPCLFCGTWASVKAVCFLACFKLLCGPLLFLGILWSKFWLIRYVGIHISPTNMYVYNLMGIVYNTSSLIPTLLMSSKTSNKLNELLILNDRWSHASKLQYHYLLIGGFISI